MMKKRVYFFVVLALLLTTNLKAVPVTFEYSGSVTSIEDPLGVFDSSIIEGSLFNGSYTFNSDATDTNPSQEYGRYIFSQPAPEGFSMTATIETAVFETITYGDIAIDNRTDFVCCAFTTQNICDIVEKSQLIALMFHI